MVSQVSHCPQEADERKTLAEKYNLPDWATFVESVKLLAELPGETTLGEFREKVAALKSTP
jgi:hypothetical protein